MGTNVETFSKTKSYLFTILLFLQLTGCSGGSSDNASEKNSGADERIVLSDSEKKQHVQRFVDDLKSWQDTISLSPEEQSFDGVGEAAAKTATGELTEMVQTLAVAGRQATLVALPELFLKNSCDKLDIVSGFVCHQLIAGKTLSELCNSALNLQLFGRPLCDLLNEISLPVEAREVFKGNALTVRFALLDGSAELSGYDTGTDISLKVQLAESGFTENQVFFSVSGVVKQGDTELKITTGTFKYHFESLDGETFQLPLNMDYQLQVMSEALADNNSAGFEGSIEGSIDFDNEKPFQELIGLDKSPLVFSANGHFVSALDKHYPAELLVDNRQTIEIQLAMQVQTADLNETADVAYDAGLDVNQQEPLNFTISWDKKSYQVMRNKYDADEVTVSNHEDVIMSLDYGQSEDQVGNISVGGQHYGKISVLNGSLLITLLDGTELVL